MEQLIPKVSVGTFDSMFLIVEMSLTKFFVSVGFGQLGSAVKLQESADIKLYKARPQNHRATAASLSSSRATAECQLLVRTAGLLSPLS